MSLISEASGLWQGTQTSRHPLQKSEQIGGKFWFARACVAIGQSGILRARHFFFRFSHCSFLLSWIFPLLFWGCICFTLICVFSLLVYSPITGLQRKKTPIGVLWFAGRGCRCPNNYCWYTRSHSGTQLSGVYLGLCVCCSLQEILV